jgi:hypothetical protein
MIDGRKDLLMPLTLTVSAGVLPEGTEREAFKQLSDAMLRWHGGTGNTFLTPMVVGSINIVTPTHTYSGSAETPVVFIEWKTPSFAFATREIQQGYIAEATAIIHDLSGGQQPKERIWVNVVHSVDGAWGVAGNAMTNAELGAAAAAAAAT